MATPRMAAGALFVDDAGAVLMVRPTYKEYGDIPGGYVEPGESPRAACVREVREELGIEPAIGRLLVVDWAPNESEGDKLLFIFDGGVLSADLLGRIQLQAEEIGDFGYCPVDQLSRSTIPRLARRLSAAAGARVDGSTRYLEHGE
jgi:ADP-ribose pyrophosphatase YjhB (NUDIX family)